MIVTNVTDLKHGSQKVCLVSHFFQFIEQDNLCRCIGFIAYTAVLLFDMSVPFYLYILSHNVVLIEFRHPFRMPIHESKMKF